jgi:serine/threonine-protein kinase
MPLSRSRPQVFVPSARPRSARARSGALASALACLCLGIAACGGSTSGSPGSAGSGAGQAGSTGTAGTTGGSGTSGTAATSGGAGTTGGGGSGVPSGACRFPAGSNMYADISGANVQVDSMSTTYMNALQTSGWGSGLGIDVSFTLLVADASVARRPFTNNGDTPDCDTAPVPLPPGGNIEGESDYHCASGGDCHLLVCQGTRWYELYQADVTTGGATGGTFSGSCLTVWDLTHDYWVPMSPPGFSRGDGCNGADAADMPMAALILTADDIRSGTVNHPMRFTIPNAHIQSNVYVHPATHIGGPAGGTDQLPYGAHLRLKSTFDLTKLPSDAARIVARALQKYGMYLTDGGNLYISATTDVDQVIGTSDLRNHIAATDFEMIDGGTRYNWHQQTCTRTVVSN